MFIKLFMVSVFTVDLSKRDAFLLKWFIKFAGLSGTDSRFLSIRACLSDVVLHSFLEQVVLPELKNAGLKVSLNSSGNLVLVKDVEVRV